MNMKLLGFMTIALAATGVAQQGAGRQGGRGPQVPPLLLTVNGFADGAEVPIKYSCSAQPAGVSPAMEWKQVPPGTQSFLVLVHDPEPHPGKGLTDVTHWLIWNIPGTATGLPEGVAAGATLPDGAHQMKRGNAPNSVAGYGGSLGARYDARCTGGCYPGRRDEGGGRAYPRSRRVDRNVPSGSSAIGLSQ
jgi:phosphatidylethanolamine-binding protein (PEBP) family uncharacterized protein